MRDVLTPRQPIKVIVDSRLEIAPDARVLSEGRILIACAIDADAARERLQAAAQASGATLEVITLPDASGKVDLSELVRELGRRDLNEIHVESGFKLNGSLMRAGCVDELLVYFAASIIGDSGQGMFNLPALEKLDERRMLKIHHVSQLGEDLRLIARIS